LKKACPLLFAFLMSSPSFSLPLCALYAFLLLAPALSTGHPHERHAQRVAYNVHSTGAKCHYDYIVVGGGTAGLVVAARLSENPHVTVAVVEAGGSGKGDDRIDLPPLIGTPIGSSIDWKVNTVPQTHSNNISYNWPRGKVLGGRSALNFLVYTYLHLRACTSSTFARYILHRLAAYIIVFLLVIWV
jgi:hypothetical protein